MSFRQTISARVVPGHQVASGDNGNPRFPGGTLRMQAPFFAQLGLDLGRFHQGTLNVSISPWLYTVHKAKQTFRNVKWHPWEPAEDFSFFDVTIVTPADDRAEGLIYHPHPDTKPAHFQKPDVLELLLPRLEGIEYGSLITLEVPEDQMTFVGPHESADHFHFPIHNEP